ncbi:C40 family peptidase [Solidesulfovibrio fructosivorans]|uniref:C40 family peptidase n=1 Tax=Solidesulfovibrio fructosivorans TaxID=878 RepID=UPI0009D66A55|nr:C40 family peptidase [Solidesulfovibrio fructosivorans]
MRSRAFEVYGQGISPSGGRGRFVRGLLLCSLALAGLTTAASPAVAGPKDKGRAVYGYEDDCGMLHTSPVKRNAHYKLLYTGKADHETLMRALKDKDAIGGPTPPRPVAALPVDLGPLSERGERIMSLAKPYLGAPYRLGGDTPAGIDCSGLTKAVFAGFGCDLPRQSRLQAERGKPVAPGELEAGDLLFFAPDRSAGISHVGIYLGGGRMLHSSPRRGGVGVDRLPGTDYARWFVGARRLARVETAAVTRAGR